MNPSTMIAITEVSTAQVYGPTRGPRDHLPGIRVPPYCVPTRAPSLIVLGAAALLLGAGAAPARVAAPRFVGNDAPNWSSDGKRIVFTSFRHGRGEIYVVNADGSGERRLTTNPAADDLATWSADGSRIAFVSSRDGNLDVYVMNADGSGQTRLTTEPEDDFSPSWSPDGRKIVFRSNRDENGEIYVMNADGTGQTRLTVNPASDHSPAWGPTGQIAFVSTRQGTGIYVMNDDGSKVRRVTTFAPNRNEYRPNWSPDGSKIAFQGDRDVPLGNTEIYVMNADGTGQQRLTNYPGHDDWPDWSPDGGQIVFSRGASFLTPEIYVMSAAGGEAREVTLPSIEPFKFTLTPKRPLAGRRLTASLIVFEASGADLGSPTVACSAKLGGRTFAAHRAVMLGHGAVCIWNLPKTAKGKLLIGSVTARSGSSRALQAFSVRVR
jgi:Tol biopolymer transport system component